MIVECNCSKCNIASCEERSYYDEPELYFDEEYEYEKAMDRAWFNLHGNDPEWAR